MYKFKIGDYVMHKNLGEGYIAALVPPGKMNSKYLVKFGDGSHSTYCREENLTLKEKPIKMKIAVVEFAETPYKKYHFKSDLLLEKGDLVVVDTANGFAVAEVVGFREDSTYATKWVVQKVDVKGHEKRLDQIRKVESLKKELENRRKVVEAEAIHVLMSNIDPEYARIHATLAAMGEM
ncbi:hypothetical protein IAQ67_29020 (plasmid) [Paenibacillus peoriae]|uniref:Uncharacterized protein n=1 Tax=Paenibacillus peoriae TaxID=59893 RepID=A0A7H0YH40_9BACL|nr:hypothetical protein [Paenibacillus peoriae]QNR70398.1 hypothetical protein IAQ67_29020 [Paenibacillus peoriae]